MRTISMRAAVFAIAMTMPAAMHAQRGMGGGAGRVGGGGRVGMGGAVGANPVAPLIDMRRELNLSSRQLVQLDSIERTLLTRNQALRERLRSRLDTLRPRTRESSEDELARYRAEGDSLRALRQVIVRNDSVARAAAMNVLTDSQRVRVRERMAERRGFREGRMSTMRGMRGGRGMDGGPRMRGGRRGMDGPDGGMGMRGPGMRGQGMGPGMRGPDGMAPRGNMPDDRLAPRRFRRPPADGSAPEADVAPRLRRPPADSGR